MGSICSSNKNTKPTTEQESQNSPTKSPLKFKFKHTPTNKEGKIVKNALHEVFKHSHIVKN